MLGFTLLVLKLPGGRGGGADVEGGWWAWAPPSSPLGQGPFHDSGEAGAFPTTYPCCLMLQDIVI